MTQVNSKELKTAVTRIKRQLLLQDNLDPKRTHELLDILNELTKFPLGKSILVDKCFSSFWTNQILLNKPQTDTYGYVEHFLCFDAPFVLGWKEAFKHYSNLLKSHLINNHKIASIPCGLLSDFQCVDGVHLLNFNLACIDIDPVTLSQAEKVAEKIGIQSSAKFICQDAWSIEPKPIYDVVSSCGLNIYTNDPNKELKLYKNFATILKPNGTLVISFLTKPEVWNFTHINREHLSLQKTIFEDLIGFESGILHTPQEFESILRQVGFTKTTFHYDSAKIFPVVTAQKL